MTQTKSHPGAQEAFSIRGKFPWHRQFLPKVMVEITMGEPIQIEPVKRPILHGYEEEIFQEINVYSLEEIIAEKMRAILQHFKKLEERGLDPIKGKRLLRYLENIKWLFKCVKDGNYIIAFFRKMQG